MTRRSRVPWCIAIRPLAGAVIDGAAREQIRDGADLVASLQEPLAELDAGAEATHLAMVTLSDTVCRQSMSTESVAHAIKDVADMGEHNAAAAREASAAGTLRSVIADFQSAVAQFRA